MVVEPGVKSLICVMAKLWSPQDAPTMIPKGFQRGLLLTQLLQQPESHFASEAKELFIPQRKRTSYVSGRAVAVVPRQAASPLWNLSCHL